MKGVWTWFWSKGSGVGRAGKGEADGRQFVRGSYISLKGTNLMVSGRKK